MELDTVYIQQVSRKSLLSTELINNEGLSTDVIVLSYYVVSL